MPNNMTINRWAISAALFVVSTPSGVFANRPDYPFSGRWRLDTSSFKKPPKPTIIQLSSEGLNRDNNGPVKADGKFHKISDPYADEQSISVENAYVVKEIDRIRSKLAYTVEYVVSRDGKTLIWNVGNYTNPNGQAVKSRTVYRRVGLPVKGIHLIAGTWERVSVAVDSKSDWILKLDGKHFSWRTEAGTGYDAIVGGGSVKIDGDNSGARAVITRPKLDTIVETDFSAHGDLDDVLSMQLMPDKNTIRGTSRTVKQKEPTTFYLHRVTD